MNEVLRGHTVQSSNDKCTESDKTLFAFNSYDESIQYNLIDKYDLSGMYQQSSNDSKQLEKNVQSNDHSLTNISCNRKISTAQSNSTRDETVDLGRYTLALDQNTSFSTTETSGLRYAEDKENSAPNSVQTPTNLSELRMRKYEHDRALSLASSTNYGCDDNSQIESQTRNSDTVSDFSHTLSSILYTDCNNDIISNKLIPDKNITSLSSSASVSSISSRATSASLLLRKQNQVRTKKNSKVRQRKNKNLLHMDAQLSKDIQIHKSKGDVFNTISEDVEFSCKKSENEEENQSVVSEDPSVGNWKNALDLIPLNPDDETPQHMGKRIESNSCDESTNSTTSSASESYTTDSTESNTRTKNANSKTKESLSSHWLLASTESSKTEVTNVRHQPEYENSDTVTDLKSKPLSNIQQYNEMRNDDGTIANLCIEHSGTGLSSLTKLTSINSVAPSNQVSKRHFESKKNSSGKWNDGNSDRNIDTLERTSNDDVSSVVQLLRQEILKISKHTKPNKDYEKQSRVNLVNDLESLVQDLQLKVAVAKRMSNNEDLMAEERQDVNEQGFHKASPRDDGVEIGKLHETSNECMKENKSQEQSPQKPESSYEANKPTEDLMKAKYWSPHAASVAIAVMSSGADEKIAQVAAQKILVCRYPTSWEEKGEIHRLAASEISMAVLEAGASHITAASAAVAVLKSESDGFLQSFFNEVNKQSFAPNSNVPVSRKDINETNLPSYSNHSFSSVSNSVNIESAHTNNIQKMNCNIDTKTILKAYAFQTKKDVENIFHSISSAIKKVQVETQKANAISNKIQNISTRENNPDEKKQQNQPPSAKENAIAPTKVLKSIYDGMNVSELWSSVKGKQYETKENNVGKDDKASTEPDVQVGFRKTKRSFNFQRTRPIVEDLERYRRKFWYDDNQSIESVEVVASYQTEDSSLINSLDLREPIQLVDKRGIIPDPRTPNIYVNKNKNFPIANKYDTVQKKEAGMNKELVSQEVCKNEGIEMPLNEVVLSLNHSDQMKSSDSKSTSSITENQSETFKTKKGLVMHKGISRQVPTSSVKKKKGLGFKFNFVGKKGMKKKQQK